MSALDAIRQEPPLDPPDDDPRDLQFYENFRPNCGYMPCICNEDTDHED